MELCMEWYLQKYLSSYLQIKKGKIFLYLIDRKKVAKWWNERYKKFLQKLRPVQLIVLFYLLAVVVSVILLSLPFVTKSGVKWTFIDALFTSVSAVSVTGLSVVTISDTFTTAGIIILALILQLGGLGIMALGTFVWIITGKRLVCREEDSLWQTIIKGTYQAL